jgi:hypothetical protein
MRNTKIHPIKPGYALGADIYVPPNKRQPLLERFTLQGEGGYGWNTFNFVNKQEMYAPIGYANDVYSVVLSGTPSSPTRHYTTYAYTTSFDGTTYYGLSGILRIGAGNYNQGAIFRDGNVFYTSYTITEAGAVTDPKPNGPFFYPWIKNNIHSFKDLFMPSSYRHNKCQAVLLTSGELYELDLDNRPTSPHLILNNVDKFLAINQAHNADFIVSRKDNTVWHVALIGNHVPASNQSEAQQIPGLNANEIKFIQIGDPWNSLYVCLTSDTTKVYRLLTDMTGAQLRNLSNFKWITGVSSTAMNTAPAPASTLDWFGAQSGDTLSTAAVGPVAGVNYGKHKPITGFVPFNLLEPGEYFVDGMSNEFHFTWLTNRYVHTFRAYGSAQYGYSPGLAYKKFTLPANAQPVQMCTATSYSMTLQLTDGYYLLSHRGISNYLGGAVDPNGMLYLYYDPYQLFERFELWNTLVKNLSGSREDIFGYSSNTRTMRSGLTATTTFNGDEFNGIEDINGKNFITLPQKTPKNFKGFFYMDLFDEPINIYRPSPLTDECTEAYGQSWRWSSLLGTAPPYNTSTDYKKNQLLDTIYPGRPKTWSSVDYGDRFEKRWVRQQTLEPATPLPKAKTICKKDKVIWTISTQNWSVSSVVGQDITDFPYILTYKDDGTSPYTVSVNEETKIKIQACQSLKCEQILNTLTVYTDQTTMVYVHRDIEKAINDYIKPRLVSYFLFNGQTVAAKNINNIVTIKPINGKRYFKDLKERGIPPLSGNGNINVSFVFIDTPTAYLENCTINSEKTDNLRFDVSQYRKVLAATDTSESYKYTIFSVTSGNNIDLCPAATKQLSGIETGTDPMYPLPYNLADMDVEKRYKYNVLFKESSTHPNATINYYTNLIIDELKNHGVDLDSKILTSSSYTFCDSVTATILPAPVLKIYTPNRFVPINQPVLFQNLLKNPASLEAITVDFGDNIVSTYTGIELLNNFIVTYNTPGYKTLNITIQSQNKTKTVLTYPNIVNVVSYYD